MSRFSQFWCVVNNDNARHLTHPVAKQITYFLFECLPHHAYLPDLAGRDFHVFGFLMDALRGKKSRD